MIQEDYVNLETAKLLKEKGFDWECQIRRFYPKDEFDEECPDGVEAPTLQTVMKWLREVHNLHIEVRYFPTPNIYRYVILRSPMTIQNIDSHPQYFNSYEEACEAGIRYCLETWI